MDEWRPPDLAHLERLVTRSEVQRITSREPLSISQCLGRGLQAMLDEDAAEREAAARVAYIRAHRPRNRLMDRLFRRR